MLKRKIYLIPRWFINTNLLNPTIGKCFNLPKSNKRENKSPSLFDRLDVIAEEPVESKVEASAEHHGVQEDAQDQDLLRNSDQIIIHFIWNEKYLHTECLQRLVRTEAGTECGLQLTETRRPGDLTRTSAIMQHQVMQPEGKLQWLSNTKCREGIEGKELREPSDSEKRCGSGFFWYYDKAMKTYFSV